MPDTPSIGGATGVSSQLYVLTLAKSLKTEQQYAAQLLQALPNTGGAASVVGPRVQGMGGVLDALA
jgi:lantibiotic modifying enzyme